MPHSALQFIDEHKGHQSGQSKHRAQHSNQNIGPYFQEAGKDGSKQVVIDYKGQSYQRDDDETRITAVIQNQVGDVGRK